MRGVQLFEMVEKRGQPFYLIELKLYLISKSRAKALDLREERGAGISQRRGPLGRRISILTQMLMFNGYAIAADSGSARGVSEGQSEIGRTGRGARLWVVGILD